MKMEELVAAPAEGGSAPCCRRGRAARGPPAHARGGAGLGAAATRRGGRLVGARDRGDAAIEEAARARRRRGHARQRARGKLTVRERSSRCSTRRASARWARSRATRWNEADGRSPRSRRTRSSAARAAWTGAARLVGADDFAARRAQRRAGRTRDRRSRASRRTAEARRCAARAPMVRPLDGASGGGSVATILEMGYNPCRLARLRAQGRDAQRGAGRGGAARPRRRLRRRARHVALLGDGRRPRSFVAGPPVVKGATGEAYERRAGGARVHGANGAVDDVATQAEGPRACAHSSASSRRRGSPAGRAERRPARPRRARARRAVPRAAARPSTRARSSATPFDRDTPSSRSATVGAGTVVGLARLGGGRRRRDRLVGGGKPRPTARASAAFVSLLDTPTRRRRVCRPARLAVGATAELSDDPPLARPLSPPVQLPQRLLRARRGAAMAPAAPRSSTAALPTPPASDWRAAWPAAGGCPARRRRRRGLQERDRGRDLRPPPSHGAIDHVRRRCGPRGVRHRGDGGAARHATAAVLPARGRVRRLAHGDAVRAPAGGKGGLGI